MRSDFSLNNVDRPTLQYCLLLVLYYNANVGTTPLLWFVNSGSGGDLREAHRSRDVPMIPDEVGSRKGSERKRSEQGGAVR